MDDIEMDRDFIDELNAKACPLLFPTTVEVSVLREFLEMELKDKFEGEQLYHYTNCKVAQELFKENADLWCTHYRFMNDSKEWFSGLELIGDILRNQGCDELADEVDLLPEKIGCAPWITSFSMNCDKASMWGMYCDRSKGGFAFGFNRLDLEQLIDQKNQSSQDEYFLLPCIYDADSVKKILRYILDECHSDEDEHLCREGCEHELATRVLSRIFFLSLIVKHPSFDYEKEWRLIVRKHDTPPLDDEGLRLLYCKKKTHIFSSLFEVRQINEMTDEEMPHILSGLFEVRKLDEANTEEKPHILSGVFDKPLREYFARIVVSPCGNVDGNFKWVAKKKAEYNLNGLSIIKSSSPYNGR